MNDKKLSRICLLMILVVLLGGCVSTRLSNIESWDGVPDGQVVLVGSLSHGYDVSEWVVVWDSIFAILNYSTDFSEIDEPSFDTIRQIKWGESFTTSIDRSHYLLLHLPMLEGYAKSSGVQTDYTFELPSILVEVPADARAVYVGEIHYEPRLANQNLVDVTIGDDFDQAAAEFYSKMGSDVPLSRAVVRVFSTEEEETLLRYIEQTYR